jgi:hypothetical protein
MNTQTRDTTAAGRIIHDGLRSISGTDMQSAALHTVGYRFPSAIATPASRIVAECIDAARIGAMVTARKLQTGELSGAAANALVSRAETLGIFAISTEADAAEALARVIAGLHHWLPGVGEAGRRTALDLVRSASGFAFAAADQALLEAV